jgi:hypothetical protein
MDFRSNYRLTINGRLLNAARVMPVVNPATGERYSPRRPRLPTLTICSRTR